MSGRILPAARNETILEPLRKLTRSVRKGFYRLTPLAYASGYKELPGFSDRLLRRPEE
jgi:hypothetical protein